MRVHANIVYNEYVADKEHLHMNSTKWETLTGFIKYLGREGHCSIEETPKGWYMTYIDRDPAGLARQEVRLLTMPAVGGGKAVITTWRTGFCAGAQEEGTHVHDRRGTHRKDD